MLNLELDNQMKWKENCTFNSQEREVRMLVVWLEISSLNFQERCSILITHFSSSQVLVLLTTPTPSPMLREIICVTSSLLEESLVRLYLMSVFLNATSWDHCTSSWLVNHWSSRIWKILTMSSTTILNGVLRMTSKHSTLHS